MTTYADLITTSNSRTPVFIDSDDRRSELVRMNTILDTVDVTWWDKFYEEELENPKIMGAFFEFFATFPIELNIRSKKCRFDIAQLNTQKIKSMKLVHKFVIDFFQDETCFESTYNKNVMSDYFLPMKFKIIENQRYCILSIDRAFEYFTQWISYISRIKPSETVHVRHGAFKQDL